MIQATLMGLLLVVGGGTADARVGLPEVAKNRAHLGGAWSPGTTHVVAGFDSRMTVNMSMDVGGFVSPGDPQRPNFGFGSADDDSPWVLRHGLYVTPGIRIPHRNRPALKWDVIVKGGFGPVWMANADSRFDLQINPALVGGFDFMLRIKEWGVRVTNRWWYTKPFSREEQVEIPTVRPQLGASIQYEF